MRPDMSNFAIMIIRLRLKCFCLMIFIMFFFRHFEEKAKYARGDCFFRQISFVPTGRFAPDISRAQPGSYTTILTCIKSTKGLVSYVDADSVTQFPYA